MDSSIIAFIIRLNNDKKNWRKRQKEGRKPFIILNNYRYLKGKRSKFYNMKTPLTNIWKMLCTSAENDFNAKKHSIIHFANINTLNIRVFCLQGKTLL